MNVVENKDRLTRELLAALDAYKEEIRLYPAEAAKFKEVEGIVVFNMAKGYPN